MGKLELFNTTDRVKIVPGYRYAGKKITLEPKASYGIEDYMSTFYRPYARIGVIVRAATGAITTEVAVEETTNNVVETTPEAVENGNDVEEPTNEAETANETTEDNGDGGSDDITEEVTVEDTDGDVNEDEEETDSINYTVEELLTKNIDEVKAIATELGLDIEGIRRKKDIAEKIVDSLK